MDKIIADGAITATNGSTISNSSIKKNNFNIKYVRKVSFIWGLIGGIISSLIATLIWHYF
jgi:hypothetical protein